MVSKANEDLPEPLKPVITVSRLRGISTSMFLRLCWRAPWTEIWVSIGKPERGRTDSYCHSIEAGRAMRGSILKVRCWLFDSRRAVALLFTFFQSILKIDLT